MKPYDFVEKDGEVYAVPNEKYWSEMGKKKYKIMLERSNIPHFYHNVEFSDYKGDGSKRNVQKIIKYAKECFTEKFDHIHLYLWGVNNTQKTALACNIGKEAIKQGKEVKFILAGTLIDRLMKNQGFSYTKEIEHYINDLKSKDLLIIDDAFTNEKSLMWKNPDSKNLIISEWDRFLRETVVSNTKIIVTSNIPHESIKEYYSKSLYELIDRNFIILQLLDNIKLVRKNDFKNLLED